MDQAIPTLPEFPHPPLAYDEARLPELNQRWQTAGEAPAASMSGWKRWLSTPLWRLVRGRVEAETHGALERQAAFNSILVDHLNRNVAVQRSTREAVETSVSVLRGQLEALTEFHARLVQYLQQVTPFIDTKDRSEMLAGLVLGLSSGLNGVSDEFRRQRESMEAREQRYVSAVDELRTSIASVQQTGADAEARARAAASPLPAQLRRRRQPSRRRPPRGRRLPISVCRAHDRHRERLQVRGLREQVPRVGGRHPGAPDAYVDVFRRRLGRARPRDAAAASCSPCSRSTASRRRGLDINHEMVEACLSLGLDAREGDAIAYLESLPDASLGGLVAAAGGRALPPAYLVRFLDVAFHKLRPGARIVLETLNPSCWLAFFEAYIRDITHAWPLHPETLKFLVVASGFQRVDVRMLSPYPEAAKLQHVSGAARGRTAPGRRPGVHVQREREQAQRADVLVPGLRGDGRADVDAGQQ